MIDAGLDCYLTLVDDQAIDAVLRVQVSEHSTRYFDIQIKSGRTWAAIRGNTDCLSTKSNAILVLYNSALGEAFWLEARAIRRLFSTTNSSWGNIFLNGATLSLLKTYTLPRLMRVVGVTERPANKALNATVGRGRPPAR
jgi:hypothetical protein